MRPRRGGALCALVGVAVLAGCGGAGPDAVGDPRPRVQACLRSAGVAVRAVGPDVLAAGAGAGAPRIVFTSNVGEAATADLQGRAEDAERIGAALLYVGDGDPRRLEPMERCLASAAPRGSGASSR